MLLKLRPSSSAFFSNFFFSDSGSLTLVGFALSVMLLLRCLFNYIVTSLVVMSTMIYNEPTLRKERVMIEAGSVYRVEFPFKFEKYRVSEDSFWGFSVEDETVWLAGCHQHVEDGAQIAEGYYEQCYIYTCDAIGHIEYEVLAIVPIGDKLSDRAIYRKTYHYPDGKVRKFSPQLMTVSLLEKRIKEPFKVEYELEPSVEAMQELKRLNPH